MAGFDDLLALREQQYPGSPGTNAPAPAAPEADDPFSVALRRREQDTGRLQVSVDQGLQIPALTAANHDYLSKVTGIPLDVVKTQEGAVKALVKLREMTELADTSPTIKEHLMNPDFLAQAHEDKPALTALVDGFKYVVGAPGTERSLIKDAGNTALVLGMGATAGVGKMIIDSAAVPLDLVGGLTGVEGFKNAASTYRAQAKRTEEAMNFFGPEATTSTGKATVSGLQSAGTNIALLPIGLARSFYATATQAASATAAAMGVGTGAGAYNEARDAGKNQAQALTYAIPQGVFEYAFEKIPAAKLFHDLEASKALTKVIAGQVVPETVTEQLTTLSQDFNTWMNLNPDKTLKQYLQERPDAAYQTFIATLVGVGAQTSVMHGVNKVATAAGDDANKQYTATAEFERLTALLKAASDSTLRKNNPSTFAEVTQQIAEENKDKGAPTEVRFDARTLGEVLNQEEIDSLPSVKQQLESGELLPGDEITVPIGELLANVAGTPLEQKLMEHARVGENEYSQAEAKEASSKAADYLAQESQRVIAAATDSVAHQESANKVKQLYLDQFNKLGRFTPDVNEINAIMVSNMYVAMGAREGLTPEQAQQKRPLEVTGVNPARDSETLQHDGSALTPEEQARSDAFEKQVADNPDLVEKYIAKHKNVVDPDLAKTMWQEYNDNPGGMARVVHEASSKLAKQVYAKVLADHPGAPVTFTAGGGGSGKTEAMPLAVAALGRETGGLVYDSALSNFNKAKERIDATLAAGSPVDIVYTNREVGDAFTFAMGRERVVPIKVLAAAHVNASDTLRQLAAHYAGNPQVQIAVVNNLGALNDMHAGDLADVPKYEYNTVERRLYDLAKQAFEQGAITSERHRSLTGSGPTATAEGQTGESSGSLQGKEQGQDLGAAGGRAGSLSLDAYHFSKAERPNLDTGHYGTGLKGSGRETYLNASDKRLSKRLSFYVDTGHGVRPESGVGGVAHKVHLTNIYDSNTDPLRLRTGSQTDFESRVLDAGYSGYLDRLSGTQPGHVILLGDQSVKPEVLGPMSKVEGTTPVAPAGPRASLGRDVVLDQLRADKSLPAGSVPLSRWKEVLAKDPEVLDAFERAGVLDAVTRELDGSLRGLPRAIEGYSPSVFNTANAVAESYMASRGETYNPPTQYVKVDKPRAERIAKAFEEMKHDPQNPEVKAAYTAMIDETLAQYEEILKTGIQIEFVKGEDPYKGNPRNMTEDVRKNNHMWVFSTRDGFGTDASFDPKDNPLLAETKYTFGGEPALANDIFRAVHDYFGHVKEGLGFRADGEENAWRAHAAMFSPTARRAMTTETRGQNSWLNFGPHGESNRTAKVEDTHFADQKIGLLPQWVTDEGRTDPPGPSMYKSELFKDFESKTDEPVYGQNEKLAELARIEKHLTDKERGKLNKGTAAKLIAQFDKLPAADEFAAVAWAGRAKRGWYKESANAIGQVFGPDAPRFAGLLAAMSPQNSVQTNLLNSLNMWKNWVAAGRPQTRKEIIKTMGASVEGSKGVKSVLDAWINNSVRALTTENPGIDLLSGPKVDSFMRNLLGNVNEVTNDAWMSNFALVDQKMFKGGLNKTDAGKGPGYLAMNAKVREAAKILTKRTGETWTPAEVQETIWSWAKTLYEAQNADKTAREILMDEELTDDMLRSTPDFKGLFYDAKYEKILRDAGLGDRLSGLDSGAATTQVPPAGGETAPFGGVTQARHENRAAKRLEILRRDGKPGGDVLDQKVDGHVVNIGLDVEGGEQLKPQEVIDTLQSFGVKVEEHKVHTSNTEPTVVARLDRPLTPEEANAVSVKLKQQAIAQMSNGEGSIHGPQAEAWSPFNPDYFLALNGQPASALEQPGGSRGTYNPRTLTISLLENANLSTFHHEMAHFYLDALAQMATDGNPNATDDMGKLLKWFGVDSLDTWNKMSLNEKRASHEKFAEHYETYLFEGKAPSKELHSTFRRLASWMMNAYKNMMEFLHSRSTSLTPEVRGVYDRMLATEAQIADTEAARKMTPMFTTAEEANMDSAEWAQYQLGAQDASEEAIETLRTRSLRDLKWSISARNKAIKVVTKDVEAKRKATEAEVRAEVEQMPVYVAKSYLDSLGEERNDADIQFMSEQLGYTSPDEMLRAIKEAQPIKHVIEGMTDQRLLERYGDLTTPKGIEAAANEAIHNEARAKFVATELRALEDGVRLKTAADTTVLEKLKECLKS